MTGEVRANYVELAQLANGVLSAADGVADGLAKARDGFTLSADAFGNMPAGEECYRTQELATERVGRVTERLIEVMEGDVDRLYGVAFAYQAVDQDAAADLRVVRGSQLA